MSSLFEHVVSALFGSAGRAGGDLERGFIDETTDAIVEIVEPRIKVRSGYRDKLAEGVKQTVTHLRELARRLPPEPLQLSRGAWADDPYVRAFFAAAADVSTCVGRSEELRQFFADHPECSQACALLGMQRSDRKILAPRLEGGEVRQDVAQTTISFSGHRLLAPTTNFESTRLEVGRRIVQRLAQLVLARVVAFGEQVQDLQMRKAQLGVRLRMLKAGRAGMQSLVSEGPPLDEQIRDVERELKALAVEHSEARGNLATLDSYIDHINVVLCQPQEHVALQHAPVRVTRLGIKADAGTQEDSDELELAELSIGDGLHATIAFVRISRDELPPREDLLAQAQRAL